uniref:Uncharacterized protein n=1 Tax=Arundo donax TaxID=35708 RepID=A0A0A9F2E8_ARUDO
MINSKGSPSKPNFSKTIPSSSLPVYLIRTVSPSCGVRIPSPYFNVFFSTFKSPVTSTTGFNETNCTSILTAEFGGTAENWF